MRDAVVCARSLMRNLVDTAGLTVRVNDDVWVMPPPVPVIVIV